MISGTYYFSQVPLNGGRGREGGGGGGWWSEIHWNDVEAATTKH